MANSFNDDKNNNYNNNNNNNTPNTGTPSEMAIPVPVIPTNMNSSQNVTVVLTPKNTNSFQNNNTMSTSNHLNITSVHTPMSSSSSSTSSNSNNNTFTTTITDYSNSTTTTTTNYPNTTTTTNNTNPTNSTTNTTTTFTSSLYTPSSSPPISPVSVSFPIPTPINPTNSTTNTTPVITTPTPAYIVTAQMKALFGSIKSSSTGKTDIAPLLATIPLTTLNSLFKHDNNNCTLLYYACLLSKIDVVVLLSCYPGVSLDGNQDKSGNSPIDAALTSFNSEIVAYLGMCGVPYPLNIPQVQPQKMFSKEFLQLRKMLDVWRECGKNALGVLYPKLEDLARLRNVVIERKLKSNPQLKKDIERAHPMTQQRSVTPQNPPMSRITPLSMSANSIRREQSSRENVELEDKFVEIQNFIQKNLNSASLIEIPQKPISRWFVETSANLWEPYSTDLNHQIDNASSKTSEELILQPNQIRSGQTHKINFTEMKQINIYSQGKRDIVKIPYSSEQALLNCLEFALKQTCRIKQNESLTVENMNSPINEVAERFNVDIVVHIRSEFQLHRCTISSHESKSALLPTYHIYYNSKNYYPILELLSTPTTSTSGLSPKKLYTTTHAELHKVINDTEAFVTHLETFDLSKINEEFSLTEKSCTLLYLAAKANNFKLVATLSLLDKIKLDGEQERPSLSSPLHVASWYGYDTVLAILLAQGANPDNPKTNLFGETCRKGEKPSQNFFSIWSTYSDSGPTKIREMMNVDKILADAKRLLDSHNIPTSKVGVPQNFEEICLALFNKTLSNIQFSTFLSNKTSSSFNRASLYCGMTPFYISCQTGNISAVQLMIHTPGIQKDDLQQASQTTRESHTPLHAATYFGQYEILAMLLLDEVPQQKNRTKNGEIGILPSMMAMLPDTPTRTENLVKGLWCIESLSLSTTERKTHLQEIVNGGRPVNGEKLSSLYFKILPSKSKDIPPLYFVNDFLFFDKTNEEVPLDISSNCILDRELKKLAYGHSLETVTFFEVPTWASTTSKVSIIDSHLMNFELELTKTTGKQRLSVCRRTPRWYYETYEGIWVPFSYKISTYVSLVHMSTKMNTEYHSDDGCIWIAEKDKKKITCTSKNTNTKNVYSLKKEDEFKILTNWRPSIIDSPPSTNNPLIELPPENKEYQQVANYFYLTMPKQMGNKQVNQIVKISRIFHPQNSQLCETRLGEIRQRQITNDPTLSWVDIEYKKLLWHGTGEVPPREIYETPGAWNLAYASSLNLWGRGIYFASAAGYSAGYSYKTPAGTNMMFLAEVVVGNSFLCNENQSIKIPPPGFDSVVGVKSYNVSGVSFSLPSVNYVLYDNARAFPTYLVEWKLN